MKTLQIVADENLSGLASFSDFAELKIMPGRDITARDLRDADALLVRSVTRVNAELLKDTRLSFVGSATSGIDHVDLDYLQSRHIAFAYAPASNARAVVEYVFAALAFLSEQGSFDWRQRKFGIIGGGHIGSLLAEYCEALQLACVIHDPYLPEDYRFASKLVSLDEVLRQDLISLHTSLNKSGAYPSYHLLNEKTLACLHEDCILINAARGPVIDTQALIQILRQKLGINCVLDVWEQEPAISRELLQNVSLGTPHIAGYSLEGKEQGSAAIHRALLQHFSLVGQAEFTLNQAGSALSLKLPSEPLQQINHSILRAYDIAGDSDRLKQASEETDIAVSFDQQRKNYQLRREFRHFEINSAAYSKEAVRILQTLGFAQA